MTGLVFRVALLLFIPLTAAAGTVQLVAISNAGYACLVVPVGPDMSEWTLDVRSGRAILNLHHVNAPIPLTRYSSPDGRYRLGSWQYLEGEIRPFGWYLEDTHTGTRTSLPHSFGYTIWSDDSSTVAYITETNELLRQLTIVDAASGTARTQPIAQDDDLAGISPDGRYLLLRIADVSELHILRTVDLHEVVRVATTSSFVPESAWSPQSSHLVLSSGISPIMYDLNKGTIIGLPALRTPKRSIFWAPNSERFALLSQAVGNRVVLNLFDAAGEVLLPQIEVQSPSRDLARLDLLSLSWDRPPWNVWSADSARFAVIGGETLSIIDLTTGQQETLIDRIERIDLRWGNLSPEADKYLTFVHSSDSGQALTILDLRTLTVASRLIDGATRIIPPVWTTDASRVAVKWEDSAGQTRLTWANRSDFIGHLLDEPGQLYGETAWNPAIFWLGSSPTLLYAAVRGDNRSIYSVNVETGETHTMATGLSGNYAGIMLSESPNGDRFIMSYRARGMTAEVKFDEAEPFVLLSADGRYVRALPSHWYRMYMPVWSPDGTRFAQWNDEGVTHVFDADGNRLIETTTVPYPNQSDFEWTRCEPRRVG